jgi:hypothetical protein
MSAPAKSFEAEKMASGVYLLFSGMVLSGKASMEWWNKRRL